MHIIFSNQRRGGEWESIKILLKELGVCPKIKPMNPTLAQASRQGYVVTEELLTLVHVMEAQIKEPKRTEQH
jgi:hypothetical protein